MAENESLGMLNSKFWRTSLLIVAVLLIFAGPTYVPYVLNSIVNVDYVASVLMGLLLLVIGLALLWFLIRRRVVT